MQPSNLTPDPTPLAPATAVQTPELMANGSLPVKTSELVDRYKKNGITLRRDRLKDGRWGRWTTRIRFQGKVHMLTLTERAVESVEVALRAKREIQSGRFEELKAVMGIRSRPVSSLLQLKAAYFSAPVEASENTRQQNWKALEQLLVTAVPNVRVDSHSSSIVNADLAIAWFKAATARIDIESDQAKQASLKRSANSRYGQAASVFTARALASYKLSGIFHGGFDKFLAAGEIYQFIRIPKKEYLPPSEAIIKNTFEAWKSLTDRDLFLAIGHELAFGLRAGETVQVRWGWWSHREGYPVLDGVGDFKSGTGRLTVRALDPWFSLMRDRVIAQAWRGKDEEYVITGLTTQRSDLVYRAASLWLRGQGWATQKTNHALRAYAGSQIAMRYGIYEAQTWLRHSSVLVTEQHYSYFVKAFRPADVNTMEVRWATEVRAFQPVILSSAAPA